MFSTELGKTMLPPSGSPRSRIAVIGDFTDGFDMQARKPFSGYGGTVLEQCLHNVGLIRGELYLTNVVKEKTPNKLNPKSAPKWYDERRGTFTEAGMQYVYALREELAEVEANILVAAGPAAFSALCSLSALNKYRGYLFESTLLPGRKVLPTIHPRMAMRGMYTYRYLITQDFRKAKQEADFPELRRPERQLVYYHDSIHDVQDWFAFYADQPIVGFDIEVINYEVSCISFSSSPDLACVIPVADRWSLDEEVIIWRGIQMVLGNPRSIKVVQNGLSFDIPFLLDRNGIVVRGEIHDTMIGHSIMYPELPKGLGFLGSIYCGAQEYWKDTVKFNNIKEES